MSVGMANNRWVGMLSLAAVALAIVGCPGSIAQFSQPRTAKRLSFSLSLSSQDEA
jgi:hypothetical protein